MGKVERGIVFAAIGNDVAPGRAAKAEGQFAPPVEKKKAAGEYQERPPREKEGVRPSSRNESIRGFRRTCRKDERRPRKRTTKNIRKRGTDV